MTIGEFKHCADGYKDRLEREARQTDMLNHILGNYIAVGVNNPKKYPKKPTLHDSKDNKQVFTSDEDYERVARIKYKRKL